LITEKQEETHKKYTEKEKSKLAENIGCENLNKPDIEKEIDF
jgi:hypothetical protein